MARKLSEQELVALEIRKGKPVYRTPDMEEVVHLSATSALYKTAPEWIVYQEIFQTDKMYFRGDYVSIVYNFHKLIVSSRIDDVSALLQVTP